MAKITLDKILRGVEFFCIEVPVGVKCIKNGEIDIAWRKRYKKWRK